MTSACVGSNGQAMEGVGEADEIEGGGFLPVEGGFIPEVGR